MRGPAGADCAAQRVMKGIRAVTSPPGSHLDPGAAIHHLAHYRSTRPSRLTQVTQAEARAPQPHPVLSRSLKVSSAGAFREPSAGSIRRLARALCLPGTRQRTEDQNRHRRRHDGLRSVRFSSSRRARNPRKFEYARGPQARSRHLSHAPSAGPRLQAFLSGIDRTPRRTVDFVVDLNRRPRGEIRYLIRMESGCKLRRRHSSAAPARAAIELASGADFRHLSRRRASCPAISFS